MPLTVRVNGVVAASPAGTRPAGTPDYTEQTKPKTKWSYSHLKPFRKLDDLNQTLYRWSSKSHRHDPPTRSDLECGDDHGSGHMNGNDTKQQKCLYVDLRLAGVS